MTNSVSSHRMYPVYMGMSFPDAMYSDCPQNGLMAPPTKYPNQTAQFNNLISSFSGGRGNPQSEDCLTLNIWTKRPCSQKKKGVLLWIHGGSKYASPARD